MPTQIIKQPNGLFALFSSVVDDFTGFNLSASSVLNIQLRKNENQSGVIDYIIKINNGIKPYSSSNTWQEALDIIQSCHGKEKLNTFLEEYQKDCQKLSSDTFINNAKFFYK